MKAYCELPFTRIKIDDDGRVQSCCHQREYHSNIFEENLSIEEIYQKSIVREVKNAVLTKNLHRTCNNTNCPFYFAERERKHEVSLTKYPTSIEMALPSTWCNIGGENPTPDTACFMCPRSSAKYMARAIPDRTDEIVEFIKPAMEYINQFSVLGIAEPFWKGRLFDIFDQLNFKEHKHKIYFWTISNAEIFGQKYQDKFLNEYTELSSVGFSVDAATPETYKKIRRLNMFKTVKRNITAYFDIVNQRDTQHGLILNNINLVNLHEIEDQVRFAKEVGAPIIQFNLTNDLGGDIPRNLICDERNWQYFWEGQQKAEAVAKEIGQTVEFYRPFHKGYLK